MQPPYEKFGPQDNMLVNEIEIVFIFHIIMLHNYELKIITGFLNTCGNISVLFPKKCHLIHYLILCGSNNINIFCKPCNKI